MSNPPNLNELLAITGTNHPRSSEPLREPQAPIASFPSATPSLTDVLKATGISDPRPVIAEALSIAQSRFPEATKAQLRNIVPKIISVLPQLQQQTQQPQLPVREVPTGQVPPLDDPSRITVAPPQRPDPRVVISEAAQFAPVMGATAAAALAPPAAPLILMGGVGGAVGETFRQLVSPLDRGETMAEVIGAIALEGAIEIGGGYLAKGLGSPARILRGTKGTADAAAAAMRRIGIPPALQEVSDLPFVEGGRRVIGGFPMMRKHFRKRLQRTKQAFDASTDEFVADLSPDVLTLRRAIEAGDNTTVAKVYDRLVTGAFESLGEGFDNLRALQARKWRGVQATAAQIEAAFESIGQRFEIRSVHTATRLGQTLRQLELEDLVRQVNTDAGPVLRVADDIKDEPLGRTVKYLLSKQQDPSNMSFSELLALKKAVSRRMDTVSDDATALTFLRNFKEGVEEDIEVLLRSRPDLRAVYDDANAVSSEFLNMLDELVGRKTRRFQRGGGRQAFQEITTDEGATLLKGAGSRDPVTILDELVAKSKSPKEMDQFFSVLVKARGEQGARQLFRDALALKYTRALSGAVKQAVDKGADPTYTPENFRKLMGLADKTSPEFAATMKLFERAGVSPQTAEDTGVVMQALFGVKNPKVSDFLQRRGGIGGAKAIVGGLTGGLAASTATGTGMLGPAMFFLIGRAYSKWITSPWRAKAVIGIADGSLQETVRARLFVSLLTDPVMWNAETRDERELRADTLDKLRTKQGRKEVFSAIDAQYDFPGLRKPQ